MIRLLAIFLAAFSSTVFAKEDFAKKPKVPADALAIFVDDSYKLIKFKKIDGLLISENCRKKNCLALEATLKKNPFPAAVQTGLLNPAALYCASVGGINIIAINDKSHEENVCHFKDKSYINSWDLFYSRFPK
jgi:putative hemolysin